MSDAWADVSFAGACVVLDQCFHTLGASQDDCNRRFRADLRASCDRDLERGRLLAGHRGTPDAQALKLCYQIGAVYAARAEAADTGPRFALAQRLEGEYLRYVRSVIDDTYVSVLRRQATAQETSRALATLTRDYTLGDLKAALMGNRLEAEGREPAADQGLDGDTPELAGFGGQD